MDRTRLQALAGVVLGLSSAFLAGCSPKVGDHCVLNTDCGSSGALVCDTSLPYGYCTEFNCTPDVCQNEAACVAFDPSVPGCPYDDYHSPSRATQTFCMAQCHSDSDCRQSDGYICADPRQPPWNAAIIDDDQSQLVCIPGYSSSTALVSTPDGGLPESSVCSPSGPQLDASFGLTADTGADGALDATGAEGSIDATPISDGPAETSADASEAGPDASSEAGATDGSVDGGSDADAGAVEDAADAGASDATDEG
jgi:hypothetical protein